MAERRVIDLETFRGVLRACAAKADLTETQAAPILELGEGVYAVGSFEEGCPAARAYPERRSWSVMGAFATAWDDFFPKPTREVQVIG